MPSPLLDTPLWPLVLAASLSGCALTPPPRASPKLRHWYEERNYCRGKSLERAGYGVLGAALSLAAAAGITTLYRSDVPVSIVVLPHSFVAGAVVAPALIGRGRALQRESGEYESPCDFSGRDRPELVQGPEGER